MTSRFGIVGAGVFGRLLALRLIQQGQSVTLFEARDELSSQSCSAAAAGLLDPWSGLEDGEEIVTALGSQSLELWPEILATLPKPVFFRQEGSLVLFHPQEKQQAHSAQQRWMRIEESDRPHVLEYEALHALEPDVDPRFQTGFFFSKEGQLNTREFLLASAEFLKDNCQFFFSTPVLEIRESQVKTETDSFSFDCVLDCRGLDGQPSLQDLRGVRGELFELHAPGLRLRRPIRLLHPRHPIYVIPRRNDRYFVGATVIETTDYRPVTVRSTLELLSTAFSICSEFSEAEVIESSVQCRPAMPDNLPHISLKNGIWRCNGLFRHGYLIAPRLAFDLVDVLLGEPPSDLLKEIMTRNTYESPSKWQADRLV